MACSWAVPQLRLIRIRTGLALIMRGASKSRPLVMKLLEIPIWFAYSTASYTQGMRPGPATPNHPNVVIGSHRGDDVKCALDVGRDMVLAVVGLMS